MSARNWFKSYAFNHTSEILVATDSNQMPILTNIFNVWKKRKIWSEKLFNITHLYFPRTVRWDIDFFPVRRNCIYRGTMGIIIIIMSLSLIILIMSLTPVSSSYEDIGGVPSMQSCYSAGMKRCGICMEERSPLWVRRSKSEETLCRLLITMVEETFDIRSWVDHGRPVMNLKSGYVEGENSKWKVKQRKMICGPFLIGYQAQ